jgi:hypothetical protein
VFGKKDYQHFMVIRHMVSQLALPIEIGGSETRRAQDGLALSSRKGYLSKTERAEAVQLSRVLQAMGDGRIRAQWRPRFRCHRGPCNAVECDISQTNLCLVLACFRAHAGTRHETPSVQ